MITNKRVREIINEEVKSVLAESYGPGTVFWVSTTDMSNGFDDFGTVAVIIPIEEMSVDSLVDAVAESHVVVKKFSQNASNLRLLGIGNVDGGGGPIEAFIFAQIE